MFKNHLESLFKMQTHWKTFAKSATVSENYS